MISSSIVQMRHVSIDLQLSTVVCDHDPFQAQRGYFDFDLTPKTEDGITILSKWLIWFTWAKLNKGTVVMIAECMSSAFLALHVADMDSLLWHVFICVLLFGLCS